MAQFARPDADQATGSWTTTPLWSKVEEGITGDGVYISLVASNENNNADLRLDNVTDPTVETGHIIRAEWSKNLGARTINGHVELWEGIPGTGTLRATLTANDIPVVPDTVSTYTLSAGEANSIGDYTDLYFRIYYTYTGGGQPSGFQVDAVEFEVPDAAPDALLVQARRKLPLILPDPRGRYGDFT